MDADVVQSTYKPVALDQIPRIDQLRASVHRMRLIQTFFCITYSRPRYESPAPHSLIDNRAARISAITGDFAGVFQNRSHLIRIDPHIFPAT
ncbi:hypothetical protein E3A20_12250 [Planctomyces bekefii]|uniref:Uncharacterized protein n=1 Tax=Planctomyces bekefii TaxID=1653850 RepID=A0A5C6M9D8_9PLAN|nr:hypothetical protein E3A20_12250 [Planctomyces bekefii]